MTANLFAVIFTIFVFAVRFFPTLLGFFFLLDFLPSAQRYVFVVVAYITLAFGLAD